MSVDVSAPAWKTKLGNGPAKQVLVLLAEHANSQGFGFPSRTTIADRCEIDLRTVRRVLQVFAQMGLVESKKVKHERYDESFEINLSMLGGDLREQFKRLYKIAQGKPDSEAVSETAAGKVSETTETVSQTESAVSETDPPHPLIGRTVIEPSGNLRTRKPEPVSDGPSLLRLAQDAYAATGRNPRGHACEVAWMEALAEVQRQRSCSEPDAGAFLLDRTQVYAALCSRWPAREKRFIPRFDQWLRNGAWGESEDLWRSQAGAAPAGLDSEQAASAGWVSVVTYVERHGADGRPTPGAVTKRDDHGNPIDWAPAVQAPKLDSLVQSALVTMRGTTRKGLEAVASADANGLRFVRTEFVKAFHESAREVAPSQWKA